MKLINNDPFKLIGLYGETINVEVQSQGTGHFVNYYLNGQDVMVTQNQDLAFRLKRNPTVLRLKFTFTNQHGGVYRIRVNGDAGSDVSDYTLVQSPNPGTSASLAYTFELGGDETKEDYP